MVSMSVSVSLCMYLYTAQRWPQETHALCGNQLSTWTAAASSNTATLVTMAVLVKYLHHYWIYIDVDWMKSIRLHVAVLLWQLCISRHSAVDHSPVSRVGRLPPVQADDPLTRILFWEDNRQLSTLICHHVLQWKADPEVMRITKFQLATVSHIQDNQDIELWDWSQT